MLTTIELPVPGCVVTYVYAIDLQRPGCIARTLIGHPSLDAGSFCLVVECEKDCLTGFYLSPEKDELETKWVKIDQEEPLVWIAGYVFIVTDIGQMTQVRADKQVHRKVKLIQGLTT